MGDPITSPWDSLEELGPPGPVQDPCEHSFRTGDRRAGTNDNRAGIAKPLGHMAPRILEPCQK